MTMPARKMRGVGKAKQGEIQHAADLRSQFYVELNRGGLLSRAQPLEVRSDRAVKSWIAQHGEDEATRMLNLAFPPKPVGRGGARRKGEFSPEELQLLRIAIDHNLDRKRQSDTDQSGHKTSAKSLIAIGVEAGPLGRTRKGRAWAKKIYDWYQQGGKYQQKHAATKAIKTGF